MEPKGEKLRNLTLDEKQRSALEKLDLSRTVIVASGSAIKINAVQKAIVELFPDRVINVIGVKNANSEINEQPVDDETEMGAQNRLKNTEKEILDKNPDMRPTYVSIENGIFSEKDPRTGNATGEWDDKAVVVVKLPNGRMVYEISEGVRFPKEVVEEVRIKGGDAEGFKKYTVGSQLAEKGIVKDKQDPHVELTRGVFTREMQMVNAIKGAIINLAETSR